MAISHIFLVLYQTGNSLSAVTQALGKPYSKMFHVGSRSKTSFSTSVTEHPANVKYTEQIGDQTRNYSITISMQRFGHFLAYLLNNYIYNPYVLIYTFFLIYCKDITNFLFWTFLTYLSVSVKNDNANFSKLIFMCMQKMNCIPNFFSEILQRFENAYHVPQ